MSADRRLPDETPTMLDSALDYARTGWHVLPLRGKVPLTAHGANDATTDPAIIRSWWTRWPAANIGAAVPRQLVVLDVDPRNGGRVDALRPGETLTCVSGRRDGGMHFYYRRPSEPLSSTKLPPGVDLKVSGYMVVPPSLHPGTGQPYEWRPHPVAPLPWHLLAILRPEPPRVRPMVRRGDGAGLVAFVAASTEGNRNNALYWAACRAVDDGIVDTVADDLVAVAVAAGQPLTAAQRTVASARQWLRRAR